MDKSTEIIALENYQEFPVFTELSPFLLLLKSLHFLPKGDTSCYELFTRMGNKNLFKKFSWYHPGTQAFQVVGM